MKKLILLIPTLLVGNALFSQGVKRMVLLEQFTQASCPPCTPENERIDPIIEENAKAGKMVAIKHQVSWPGYDPMYNQNKEDVDDRVNFYTVKAAPWSILDGKQMTIADWGQSEVDTFRKVPAPFSIEVTKKMNNTQDSIFAHIKIKCVQAVGGALVAQVAIVEREINFEKPPGTNGEKHFIFVLKKKLPSKAGTIMANLMNVGDVKEFDVAWKLKNVYDVNQLGVVAYVQDNSTFQIHQAGYGKSNIEIAEGNVGFNTNIINKDYVAFPNPVGNNIFNINIKSDNFKSNLNAIKIYNIQGQMILERMVNSQENEIKIDLKDLQNGLYIYQFISSNNEIIGRDKLVINQL